MNLGDLDPDSMRIWPRFFMLREGLPVVPHKSLIWYVHAPPEPPQVIPLVRDISQSSLNHQFMRHTCKHQP